MRKGALVVGVAALACLATGCATREPEMFVPIVQATPAEFEALVKSTQSPEREPAPPVVQVLARFVEIEPAKLKEVGVDPAEPMSRLTEAQWVPWYRRVRADKSVKVLSTPRITILPGQRAHVRLVRSLHYVRSYAGNGSPEIGKVPDGVVIKASAAVRGDDVVLFEITPSVWRPVEFCSNTFVVPPNRGKAGAGDAGNGDDDEDMEPGTWEEPVILVARPLVSPTQLVRVSPGEAILLPLRYSLVIGRSDVREMIKKDKLQIRHDATAEFLARLDKRGYPAQRRPVFVLVQARRVALEED